MRTNKLKLNDEKTEVVLFGTRQQLEKLGEDDTFEIKIGSEVIKPTPSARNLGFLMEAELKSQTHITKVCGTAYSTLKNIARVWNLLTPVINSYTQHLCEVQIYILLLHFTCIHDGG